MALVLVCLSSYPRELVESWTAGREVEVILAEGRPMEQLRDDLARADLVIGDAARRYPLTAEVLAGMPRCRLLMHPAVGLDGVVDLEAARAQGIEVVHAPGYNAEAVADWVLMAMLICLRDGYGASMRLRSTGWRAEPMGRELGALTVGILGFGAIGQGVRARLAGYGSRVLVSDPRPDLGQMEALAGAEPVGVDELFARSDVLTLHVPLTEGTRGMVDAERLALMPEGSVLINAARGALVDEDALVSALRDGRPASAALDVFTAEPLPADSPLLGLENLYLTPHIAAGTQQARQRVRALVGDVIAEALARYPQGEAEVET